MKLISWFESGLLLCLSLLLSYAAFRGQLIEALLTSLLVGESCAHLVLLGWTCTHNETIVRRMDKFLAEFIYRPKEEKPDSGPDVSKRK